MPRSVRDRRQHFIIRSFAVEDFAELEAVKPVSVELLSIVKNLRSRPAHKVTDRVTDRATTEILRITIYTERFGKVKCVKAPAYVNQLR